MATNEIGAVVKLEGEKQFREEMRQITQQTKLMHSEMSAMEAAWGKDATAMQKATQARAKLNDQIEKQKAIIATAKENVKQYANATGENSSQTLRWKNALAEAEAELRRLESELQNVPNKLQIVGKSMQEAGDKIKKVGDGISSVGSTLTRSVTAPVLAAGTAAVKLASDYNENLNKVDASFQDSAGEVKAWAKTATENFGMSESAALEATSLFGDMGTSMGLSTKQAAAMATEMAGLAGDLASFKNISIDQAMTALKGVFTGETESLKTLGVVMTEANLKGFAEDMGLVYDSMTQAQKVTLRYQYVLASTTNAHGDYARTADGTANALRTMAAEASNLGAAFGQEILPYITPLIQKGTELIRKFAELDDSQKNLVIRMAALAAAAGPVLTVIGKLTSAVGSAVSAGGQFVEWLGLVQAGQAAVSTTALAAGAGLSALAGFAVMAYLGYKDLKKNAESANEELYENINAVNGTSDALYSASDSIRKGFKDADQAIQDVEGSAKAATKIADEIEELASKTSLTADEQARLKVLVGEMNSLVPEMGLAFDDVSGKLNMSSSEIKNFIDQSYKMAKATAYANAVKTAMEGMAEAELAVAKAGIEHDRLLEEQQALEQQVTSSIDAHRNAAEGMTDVDRELAMLGSEINGGYGTQKIALNDATKALEENEKAQAECNNTLSEAEQNLSDNQAALQKLADELGISVEELMGMGDAADTAGDAVSELADNTEEAADAIDDSMQEIIDSYNQSYEAARDSITSQGGMFKELEKQESTSISAMRKNLQDHISAYRNWNSNASKLMSSTQYQTDANFRAMVDTIVAAGYDMAPELQAIVDAFESGDSELAGITADYGQLSLIEDYMAGNIAAADTSAKFGLNAVNQTFKTEGDKLVKNSKKMMTDTGDAIKNYDLGEPAKMAVRTISKAQQEALNQGKGLVNSTTSGANSARPGLESAMNASGVSAAANMATGIANNAYRVWNAATGLANNASGPVNGLNSYSWGLHLAENIAAGLDAKAQRIWNAAQNLANKIRNTLGHSTPKEGPLMHDDVWGLHLAENFASSMVQGIPIVKAAATDLAMAASLPTQMVTDIDAVSGRNVANALTVDDIYDAFSAAMSEQETKIVIGNREFGRILRDQGVA